MAFRRVFPVAKSPWTQGVVRDICNISLTPEKKLTEFFESCISILQNLKKSKNIGDYLEFGVFNGSSIGSMYLARKNLGINSMRLIGFDSFEGLPKHSENEDGNVWKNGFYACSFEQMNTCLLRRNIDPTKIKWVKGWYYNTLNKELVKELNLEDMGIVFVDCDTYSSSKTVLNFLAPLIKAPLIICFDDWKLNDLDIKGMGEYKAFNEFLDCNINFHIKEIKSYNRKSKSFIIQLK